MTQPDSEARANPGSDEAREQGCKCPVMDNCRGAGYMGQAGVFVMTEACPLHAQEVAEILAERTRA